MTATGRPRGQPQVGCSGWVYQRLAGGRLPGRLPQRRWFEHYATLFDTVEINNTFYRLPPVDTVDGWAAQAPTGFVYALKLGAFGSHRMKLRDAHPGCPITSTEPSVSVPRSVRLWSSSRPAGSETSNGSTSSFPWHQTVALGYRVARTLLASRRRVRCATATWRRPLPARPPSQSPPDPDHRLDLRPIPRPGRPRPEVRRAVRQQRLRTMAARLGGWLDEGCDVYAYFNNDYHGDAVADGPWLRAQLLRAPSPAS